MDLVILIAASALVMRMGLGYPERLAWRLGQLRDALAYELLPDRPYPPYYRNIKRSDMRWYVAVNTWFIVAEGMSLLLVAVTPALLLIRLRRPRPGWRALMRQPGFVAVVAAVVGFWAFWYGGYYGVPVPRPSILSGSAVLLAWAFLAATGLREREPGWVDRAGRLVGFVWIALGTITASEYWWIWRYQ